MVNNILIIGITGNGKSALASLLADNNEFETSGSGISKTNHFQVSKELFGWKDKQYRLIDNIGFGDTGNIPEEEIFLEIGEGIHSAKEGINQILFVFKGRFGPEQVETFKKFKGFIAESGITKYTTLVRTRFEEFRNNQKCEEDRQSLLGEENKELREIIDSCNGIIYVDNPPIPEIDEDEADSDDEKEINEIKEKKEAARKIVLDHLAAKCREPYKFGKWNSIYKLVDDYINKKKEIENNEEALRKLKSEVAENIKDHLKKEISFAAAIEYSLKK